MQWPPLLLDLTLWHAWHAEHGTLPGAWQGMTIEQVCGALGTPAWAPRRTWRVELPGIEVSDERRADERVLEWRTPHGVLRSRWTLGPDGDWWQAEYPVKSAQDLRAARAVAEARAYAAVPSARGPAGRDVVELPLRPWSELFHSFLGWSEGLMLFLEEPDAIAAIAGVLEEKLAALEREAAGIRPDALLCPDNLDGQFISPDDFAARLSASYTRVSALGVPVVVHVGGPAGRLLPGLSAAGVACVEGVCAAPQGDTTLAQARAACGPRTVLWGGVAQDLLLPSTPESEFRRGVTEAAEAARADTRVVVGVADRVPVGAVPERLAALVELSG